MFDIALAVFLLLSPIILLPQIGNITALQFYQFGLIDSTNSMLQLQFFQFGVIALFIVSLFQKKIRELNDKWLGLFLVGCFISVFLHPKSIGVVLNVFLGFVLYKLVFEYAKRIRLILFPIVIVSILNLIFEILQLFGIQFIYHSQSIVGLMKSQSHLGTYQALAIPICYYFNPYLVIIPIIGLLLTKTWTAVFAVILVICLKFRKKLISLGTMWQMFFISCMALFIWVLYKTKIIDAILYDLYPRLWIWLETLKSLTFTGKGFGNFKIYRSIVDKYLSTGQYDNPCSVYLEIIYILGVLSIPLFIWLHKTLKIRNKLFPSCLILVIIALGQSFMDFPRLAGTAIVLFALLNIKGG